MLFITLLITKTTSDLLLHNVWCSKFTLHEQSRKMEISWFPYRSWGILDYNILEVQ